MKSLSVVTALLFFVLSAIISLSSHAESPPDTTTPMTPAEPSLPVDAAEQKLLQAVAVIEQRDWLAASRQTEKLIEAFPNFKLGALLQKVITEQSSLPETRPFPLQPDEDEFLPKNLEAELTLRRESLSHNNYAHNLLPGSILRLGNNIRYAFVVDLEKSRFYVVKNSNPGLAVVADYYTGIGKQGIGKQREGDHRTPVGIYTIVDYLADNRLPELYGVGALPLDYPNPWDQRLGRTGSGIWLHGVPRDTYSRPPRSSRGCVTLSNHLFEAIRKLSIPGNAVVITTPNIEWRETDMRELAGAEIDAVLEQWRQDWASLDFEKYISHYSPDFKTLRGDYQSWAAGKRAVNSGKEFIEVGLENISIFLYPGKENLVQVNYRQHYRSNNFNNSINKIQYWRKNGDGRWQIVYEGSRRGSKSHASY